MDEKRERERDEKIKRRNHEKVFFGVLLRFGV